MVKANRESGPGRLVIAIGIGFVVTIALALSAVVGVLLYRYASEIAADDPLAWFVVVAAVTFAIITTVVYIADPDVP